MKEKCLLSHKDSQVQQQAGMSGEGLELPYSLTRPCSCHNSSPAPDELFPYRKEGRRIKTSCNHYCNSDLSLI